MIFNCNVKIVDSMMGSGKSSAAINYINKTGDDEKFLVITPYIDEINRYKKKCPTKNFKAPIYGVGNGSKVESLKELINKEENIVSTHALFQKFDNELIDMCRAKNYTLIMDEVADVVSNYIISKSDFEILQRDFIHIDEETNLIRWNEDKQDYVGEFSDIKRLCNLGSLAHYSGSIMMWLFPIEAFNAFRNIYILTYLFNSQMQKYYYDYYKLPYEFLYVEGTDKETYRFTNNKTTDSHKYNYNELIHIVDSEKMNLIGDRTTDLSKAWFDRNKNNVAMTQLKKNLYNFFRNIRNDDSKDNLWTTFKDYKTALQGKGYTKGYLHLNARATNDYNTRTSVAYAANRYLNPLIKRFFEQHHVAVDEDGYALSEMLQFIWRSAIRNGEEIYVYIPSIRMRTLLQQWINEHS